MRSRRRLLIWVSTVPNMEHWLFLMWVSELDQQFPIWPCKPIGGLYELTNRLPLSFIAAGCLEASILHFPLSLAMSSTTRHLTEEEQTMHHYAAMVRSDLLAYQRSTAGDAVQESMWTSALMIRLVLLLLTVRCYNKSSHSIRKYH